MSNLVKQIQSLIVPKVEYKIGRIISAKETTYTLSDSSGNIFSAFGVGYFVGNFVLVEDNKIISRIDSRIRRVWVT